MNGAEKYRRETVQRAPDGKFLPGTTPGPGRPAGARDRIRALIRALEKEAQSLGAESLAELVAQRALAPGADRLLRAVLRSVFPPGLLLDDGHPPGSTYSVHVVAGQFTTVVTDADGRELDANGDPLPEDEEEEDADFPPAV